MDLISQYAVTLRERCGVSFFVLQQENRNSANMDRRKMDMSESSAEDLKSSGNTYNDCEVCIAVYFPLKHKLKTHRGYPIIVENPQNNFIGMRDRYRNLLVIKNRLGASDKAIPVNFFGEIGYFQALPKADTIQDYTPYLHLESNPVDIISKDSEVKDEEKQQITFSF